MNKYERLLADLDETAFGVMKCFGNSMLPILSNPSTCHYQRQRKYRIDDIVFCKVKGRYIDAHKIIAVGDRGYLIANNKGWENGWTKTVYGRVFRAIDSNGNVKDFPFTGA